MQRITRKAWFGDGLFFPGFPRPVTWQAWLVTLLLVAGAAADGRFLGTTTAVGIVVVMVAIALYPLVAWLTSGRGWSWGRFGPGSGV